MAHHVWLVFRKLLNLALRQKRKSLQMFKVSLAYPAHTHIHLAVVVFRMHAYTNTNTAEKD